MDGSLTLSADQLKSILDHIEAHLPMEACGLLAGRHGRVEAVIPVTNALHSPTRFRMDPVEQLRAFEWIDEQGLDLVGIFHSHPAGPSTVSATDIAEAAYPVVHVIVSPAQPGWQVRGFWIQAGRAWEVPIHIEEEGVSGSEGRFPVFPGNFPIG